MMKEGWKLIDVRPPPEAEKVGVKGAITIPLFVPDPSWGPSSIIKKMAVWGTGGWW